jgi:hypothetical protein
MNMVIPDCVDRTVYCTHPPTTLPEGSITINTNPSLAYKKEPGIKKTVK